MACNILREVPGFPYIVWSIAADFVDFGTTKEKMLFGGMHLRQFCGVCS